jgi:uncharacterized repeat protein (TIGR01451 family)
MNRLIGVKLFAVLGFLAFAAVAQTQKDLQVTMDVKKIVRTADGNESLASADQAKPGDILQYTAVYLNKSKNNLRDLEATIPVPAYTEYVPGSSRPAGAKASVDGQKFQSIPLRRKVTLADGKEVTQLVPYADYRTIRWFSGNISVNQELKFSIRVRVLSNEAPVAPGAEKSGDGEKK